MACPCVRSKECLEGQFSGAHVLPCSLGFLGKFVTWSPYHCNYRSFVVGIWCRMIKKSTWRWSKISPMENRNWTDGKRVDEINYIKSRNSPLFKPRAQRERSSLPHNKWKIFLSCFGKSALTSVLLRKHSKPEVSMWDLAVITMTIIGCLSISFPHIIPTVKLLNL